MTLIRLTQQERERLVDLAAHPRQAREFRRAQALLWLDQGERVKAIANRLCVTRSTVYNWVKRFQGQCTLDISARLARRHGSGRPRTVHGVIDPLILDVLDHDPRKWGYRSTIWTTRLLSQYLAEAHHIEVSHSSVSLAMARLGLCWKRPRHDLAQRLKTWRQAKGGSSVA